MPPIRPLQREQAHHKRAFEVYGRLGAKRSFKAVAREMSLSVSAVRLMARSFHWADRLLEREATAARQVADQDMQALADETARNRRIVQMALLSLARHIKEGRVTGVMSDIDRLIRLEEYLAGKGKPGDRRILPEHWGVEECKKFLVDATIATYLQQPEDRERIRAAIADIDAGRAPAPADPTERRGLTVPGPVAKEVMPLGTQPPPQA